MQAAQVAAVSCCFCYIGPAHDLMMTAEGKNGCQEGQCIVTACCLRTGEVPFITPPRLLSQMAHQPTLPVTSNYVLVSHTRAGAGPQLQLDALNRCVSRATMSA